MHNYWELPDLESGAAARQPPAVSKRAAFITDVRAQIRLYRLNMLAMRQEEPSRQAEGMRQASDAAKKLQRALLLLPDAQRMKIEPDMIGTVTTRTGRRPRLPPCPPHALRRPACERRAPGRSQLGPDRPAEG